MARYSGPFVDTHHHIWLRKDVAWLKDPPIPRMFGDYFGLRRDYPVEEWMNDIVPEGATKSVHVTAMWGPGRELDETRWLQSVANQHGFPHGIVCNADLTKPGIEAELKEQTQFKNVRGVRQMLYWDGNSLRQAATRPDLCATPEFQRGFALLEKHGLHFEVQVFASQVHWATDLIKTFPNMRMILVHAGMLADRSQPGIDQWRDALKRMAEHPNLHVKLSGIGMFTNGVARPQVRQVIRDVIQIFGVERTIYGSNFPLEKLAASYADFLEPYRAALAEYPDADQRKIWHDNAIKFYRL